MEGERLIRIATEIDYEDFVVFYKFTTLPKIKLYLTVFTLVLVFLILCLLNNVFSNYIFFVSLMIEILIIFILIINDLFFKPKKIYEKYKIFVYNVVFSFYKDNIIIETKGTSSKGVYKLDYSQFKLVYETNKSFYIIKNDGNWYIINKKYIHNRQICFLRQLFVKKFSTYKKHNF